MNDIGEYILLAVISGLYTLGVHQGRVIADEVDEFLAQTNEELTKAGRFILMYLWPIATIRAMWEESRDSK